MFVVIRVDASATIGLGHLQRCMALAAALRDAGAKVLFVARRLGIDLAARFAGTGFSLRELPAPAADAAPAAPPVHAAWAGIDWAEDARDTAAALVDDRPDWIVVDHYAFDACWQRAVARQTGARMAVIDDLADRDLHADLLIDHNLAADHRLKYRGRLAPEATLLGGPRFALLGPAYAAAPRWSPHEPVRSIGIFMGGTDPAALSAVALRGCRDGAAFTGTVELVSTRANPRHASLAALAAQWPDTHVLLDLPDLASFFARHALQIGAGGGASWERCCIGAPTLALLGADNQRAVVPELARLGAVATLEDHLPVSADTIGAALRALLPDTARIAALSATARALVDGLGARRVALTLAAPTLQLRGATQADAELTYRWRNHAATRAVSRTAEPIVLGEHQSWLRRTLADPARNLQIGHVGSIEVGVIRFDMSSDGTAEVSLYLDPELHGLGLGRALLRAGEDRLRHTQLGVKRLTATVLAGNAGSRRLFESAGYTFTQDRGDKSVHQALAQEEIGS